MSGDVIRKVEFSKLRTAYSTVKEFIRTESLDGEYIRLKTRIEADLGHSGDDNYELLEKFVKRYSLDHSKFRYDEHFHSEGELFGSGQLLRISLSFYSGYHRKYFSSFHSDDSSRYPLRYSGRCGRFGT